MSDRGVYKHLVEVIEHVAGHIDGDPCEISGCELDDAKTEALEQLLVELGAVQEQFV